MLRAVQSRIKPMVHCFGHVHEGYGVSSDGRTTFVNASTCTTKYKPNNPPIVFDIMCDESGGDVHSVKVVKGL